MRDRLIELINKGSYCPPDYDGEERDTNSIYHCEGCKYEHSKDCTAERIADALIANGVILPPCRVGDIVYCINAISLKSPIINVCEVDALHITSGKNHRGHKKPSYALMRGKDMKSLSTRIYFDSFGKTVFLTKEEAGKALKEKENGNILQCTDK